MRPMWMEYPDDPITFELDTQYLFGDSFLIAATAPSSYDTYNFLPNFYRIQVYLPSKDDWYCFITSEITKKASNLQHIRLSFEEIGIYVKAGSIIPRKIVRRTSAT